MRKGVLTKTSIKVLLSLLLLIGSFEPVVSASYGGVNLQMSLLNLIFH